MAIKLNLLAEAHVLEDMRRRDPVKRAIIGAAVVIVLVLVWSSSIQLKAIIARGELTRLEAQISSQTNAYSSALSSVQRLRDVKQKLNALNALASNRMLHGNLLNALQQTTVDNVQLVRLRTDHSYILNEAVKARTNANNKVVPGKPATVTERIVLTLEGKDTADNPGDQVSALKSVIAQNAYFQAQLDKTNEVRLVNLSPPNTKDSRPSVLFTLECRYPEVTR
jgi:hypothetical protein